MRRLTGILVLFLIVTSTFANSRDYVNLRRNRVYITAGSSGFFTSSNLVYERNLSYLTNSEFNVRIGVGQYTASYFTGGYLGPQSFVNFGFVRGFNYHFFESYFGAAVLYDMDLAKRIKDDPARTSTVSELLVWSPSIYLGYRFKKPYGKFFFRAGIGWPEQACLGFGYGF